MSFKVLFVGVGNTCRTPMAEGFAKKYGLRAESAGTMPGKGVTPQAVQAMKERDIDISNHKPKQLDFYDVPDFDRVVIIGDGVTENAPGLRVDDDWGLHDVLDQPLQGYRDIRDHIERNVKEMVDELREWNRA